MSTIKFRLPVIKFHEEQFESLLYSQKDGTKSKLYNTFPRNIFANLMYGKR